MGGCDVAVTDQRLSQVQDLCRVIAPTQRGAYLELLAYNLRGVELGDGSVRSTAVRTMREFLQRGGGGQNKPEHQSVWPGRPPETFSARSADLTGLKMRRITRAAVAVGTCISWHAPRPDPYVRLSRIRLLPRVCDGTSCRIRSSACDTRAWF